MHSDGVLVHAELHNRDFFFFFLSIILYYLMNIYMQIHSLLYMEFNLKSNFFVELYWDAN